MSGLRSSIEAIIVEHLDPSVMGRIQVVDDIMDAIKEHNEALANRSMPTSRPMTGADLHYSGPTSATPRRPWGR